MPLRHTDYICKVYMQIYLIIALRAEATILLLLTLDIHKWGVLKMSAFSHVAGNTAKLEDKCRHKKRVKGALLFSLAHRKCGQSITVFSSVIKHVLSLISSIMLLATHLKPIYSRIIAINFLPHLISPHVYHITLIPFAH